jgi:hypothetical protein
LLPLICFEDQYRKEAKNRGTTPIKKKSKWIKRITIEIAKLEE